MSKEILGFVISCIFTVFLLAGNNSKVEQKVSTSYCALDADCVLLRCSGCVSKDFLKMGLTDLPCMGYGEVDGKEKFVCKCISNKCETKPI